MCTKVISAQQSVTLIETSTLTDVDMAGRMVELEEKFGQVFNRQRSTFRSVIDPVWNVTKT